jgi:hypothetical protein
MTLEKAMVVKMESEMRVAAVGRHYSVNELSSHVIGKMKTKLRESKSSIPSSTKIPA